MTISTDWMNGFICGVWLMALVVNVTAAVRRWTRK